MGRSKRRRSPLAFAERGAGKKRPPKDDPRPPLDPPRPPPPDRPITGPLWARILDVSRAGNGNVLVRAAALAGEDSPVILAEQIFTFEPEHDRATIRARISEWVWELSCAEKARERMLPDIGGTWEVKEPPRG